MALVRMDAFGSYEAASSVEFYAGSGTGAYAASSVSGANTRRYHALLAAPLERPMGVFIFLAGLEEMLLVGSGRHYISTHEYPGAVFPEGWRHLQSFEMDPLPTFIYEAQGARVRKRIASVPGSPTVVISYELLDGPAGTGIEIRPLGAFRDRHQLTHVQPHRDGRRAPRRRLDSPPAVRGAPGLAASLRRRVRRLGQLVSPGAVPPRPRALTSVRRGLDDARLLFSAPRKGQAPLSHRDHRAGRAESDGPPHRDRRGRRRVARPRRASRRVRAQSSPSAFATCSCARITARRSCAASSGTTTGRATRCSPPPGCRSSGASRTWKTSSRRGRRAHRTASCRFTSRPEAPPARSTSRGRSSSSKPSNSTSASPATTTGCATRSTDS